MYMNETRVDVGELRSAIAGEVFDDTTSGWHEARRAWNLAVDQHPAAIARPFGTADVAATVRFAAANGLRVAPQGTGHNAAPMASLERSLLLRTDRMRGVHIDAGARRARVEAGAIWADVATPASELGLAALAGSSHSVGVVGYHVGGGLSIGLGRKFGLAANHVTGAEVVTADGEIVRADRDSEPDLFWAIRGGGGNFGVVTALEFGLFDLPSVYAGMMAWPLELADTVLRRWRDWAAQADDEVTTSLRLLRLPDVPDLPDPIRGRELVVIDGAHAAGEEAGRMALAPLRELAPELDTFGEMAPVGLSYIHMDPPEPVPGLSSHQMISALTDEAIDAVLELAGPGLPTSLMMVELRQLGGALGRAPEDAGALGSFAGDFALFAGGSPMTPELGAAIEGDLEGLRGAMAPHDARAPYLNFTERPGTDAESAFSIEAARRLREVKAAYDPYGRIQANHEIDPV
jgi:hypothetical protein